VAGLFIWLIKNSPTIDLPILLWLCPFIFPVLAVLGVWISYLIGKRYLFVYQLAKFLLIGAFFSVFDLIIFNFLLGYFGISREEIVRYAFFVVISFTIVTVIKYLGDKYWAFEKNTHLRHNNYNRSFTLYKKHLVRRHCILPKSRLLPGLGSTFLNRQPVLS